MGQLAAQVRGIVQYSSRKGHTHRMEVSSRGFTVDGRWLCRAEGCEEKEVHNKEEESDEPVYCLRDLGPYYFASLDSTTPGLERFDLAGPDGGYPLEWECPHCKTTLFTIDK